MKNITNAIRQKRFHIKPEMAVKLCVESVMGNQFEFQIQDASISSVKCSFLGEQLDDSFLVDAILPESKLMWAAESSVLGKLLLRRVSTTESGTVCVFSCIEGKIPLNGSLAKFFDRLEDGDESPFDYEINHGKFSVAHFAESTFNHPDILEKCRQFEFFLQDFKKNPLYQYFSVKKDPNGSRAKFKLSRTGSIVEAVNFASYDYLGFSSHPLVKEAAIKAIEQYGVSSEGTQILSGKTALHEELESKISSFFGRPDAILFTSGFAANLATITALLSCHDFAVADVYAHASLHDAIGASRAKTRLFKHNNIGHLDNLLTEHRGEENGVLVVSEGLFSMEGTVPDVKALTECAEKHNARLFMDECHSIGIMGETGLGAAERYGVLDKVDVYMGSFSKGLGGGACGFITGEREVIKWLRFFGRAGMFSAALAPNLAAACIKILDLIRLEPHRRIRLQHNIQRLRAGLKRLNLELISDEQSPIIPIIIPDEKILGAMNQTMISRGVYVNCILYPAVPMGKSRFRFSVTFNHTDSDIDLAIFAMEDALRMTGQR